MLNKILTALGLRSDVGGPVHAGVNPVYFTYVSFDEMSERWVFSWHDDKHAFGSSFEYYAQEEAETARKFWEGKKAAFEHASFVRP